MVKPTKQTYVLDDLLLKLLTEYPNGIRLTDFEKILKDRLTSKGVTDYFKVGSRHTIIEALKRLRKENKAVQDIDTRRYLITVEGKQYVEKIDIVKVILSSNQWKGSFTWAPSSKDPAASTYILSQADRTSNKSGLNFNNDQPSSWGGEAHSMILLEFRLRKIAEVQPLNWEGFLSDVIDYVTEIKLIDEEGLILLEKLKTGQATVEERALFLTRLKVVWDIIFKDVQKITTVQYIDPKLMLERISAEIS